MFNVSGVSRPSTSGSGRYPRKRAPTSIPDPTNPMKDIEVPNVPDDSISALQFSPGSKQQNFIACGSWDETVRFWEVANDGTSTPKALQVNGAGVLDIAWSHDCSKIYVSGTDHFAKMWDLQANVLITVANHSAPVKTCHWVHSPNFSGLMTGSWDKTLKLWDIRSPLPVKEFALAERCYCADVDYPVVVVGMAGNQVALYNLEGAPQAKQIKSLLKYQHRCVAIFRNKEQQPEGFALGCTDGQVAIHYPNSVDPKDNFTFRCHRMHNPNDNTQHVYAVNDIAFHPVHGTLATVGSDGTFMFWDKDIRSKLKTSGVMEQSITKCDFNHDGQIFAYAVSYDWSMGHEYHTPQTRNRIFLRQAFDETKPKHS